MRRYIFTTIVIEIYNNNMNMSSDKNINRAR